MLAEIGALNAFGYDRRAALWQVEQAVRPEGELFEDVAAGPCAPPAGLQPDQSPLAPMSDLDRMTADYAGTGVTTSPGRTPASAARSAPSTR